MGSNPEFLPLLLGNHPGAEHGGWWGGWRTRSEWEQLSVCCGESFRRSKKRQYCCYREGDPDIGQGIKGQPCSSDLTVTGTAFLGAGAQLGGVVRLSASEAGRRLQQQLLRHSAPRVPAAGAGRAAAKNALFWRCSPSPGRQLGGPRPACFQAWADSPADVVVPSK